MNWQLKHPELSRKTAALNTATSWGRSKHTAESIISWVKGWIQARSIELSQRGKHAMSYSRLSDEGTLIAVREYIKEASECIDSIRLKSFLQNFKINQYIYHVRYIWLRSCQGSNKILDNTKKSAKCRVAGTLGLSGFH